MTVLHPNGYTYRERGRSFHLDPQALKAHHKWAVARTDDEFFGSDVKETLHLTTFLCFVHDKTAQEVLADGALLHELVHVVHLGRKYAFPEESVPGHQQWRDDLRQQFRALEPTDEALLAFVERVKAEPLP